MEAQAGSGGRSVQHTASHGERVWGEQWMATAHGWPVAWLLWDAWLGGDTGQSCTYVLANPCRPISHDYRVPKASAGVVTLHLYPAPETHIPGLWDCPPSIFTDGREECPWVIYRSGAREREKNTIGDFRAGSAQVLAPAEMTF